MPRLPTDFSEAQDFSPLPTEENPYHCQVTDIGEVQEGENSLYVSVEMTVIEPEEYQNRKIWRNLPITGKGAGFWIQFVRKALGNMELDQEEIADIETEDIVGCLIDVNIEHEEYPEGSGNIQNRVGSFMIAS